MDDTTTPSPADQPELSEPSARTGPPSWDEQVAQIFGATEGMGDGAEPEAGTAQSAPAPASTEPDGPAPAPQPSESTSSDPVLALLQEMRAEQSALKAELAALREGRAAPAAQATAAQPQTQSQSPVPAQPDPAALKARQDRMLRDPHYAQAVGLLGTDVPEHVALNARHLLEGRAYYTTRTEDATEGSKARAAIERIDAQLESVRETAALYRRLAAQAQVEQPAPAPASVPLAQRLTYADRLVAGLRSNAPAIADLAGLTEAEVMRLAAETEGADEGAWFDAFFERAYAAAQKRRAQQPATSAQKAAEPAKGAQSQRPKNGALREVRNPAPVGAGSSSATAADRKPWPRDRPPTDSELEDYVFARN
jgi:hypothetical protein